ncbi:hypothetical protein BLNAU_11649 [Blattamonas nauphoetae]|uniref:SPRY domain-containing protein n=1 Tax=Blattamonas nauphoetae TaxID=2049346 RepID=A0ABQ9XR45_9EUKA|nr:hypothetical protein BLNAU_11649 [Blattamonas nauphoetae]
MLDPDCGSRLTSKQLAESSILRCLINTAVAGWKLLEMKSRETEKRFGDMKDTLRTSEWKVVELTKDKRTLQHQLKKEQAERQKEKAEAEKKQNELKRRIEELEAMMQGEQPQVKDRKNDERKETEHQIVRQRAERTQARVVRSRSGADTIELFPADGYSLSGSVFTCTRGNNPTLLSFSFGKVIARFTFTFSRITVWNYIGIVASSQTEKVKDGRSFSSLLGGAGWDGFWASRQAVQNGTYYSSGSACAAGKEGQRVVLEADGRDGKRTLRLSQNGQTQPTFFSNIPVPFRFAILLGRTGDSVSIESVEELTETTLNGGTTEIKMNR